jgi:hypothetical protein
LGRINLQGISPQPQDTSFFDWWRKSNVAVTGAARKGLNALILGAWVLWKHRNRVVFDAATTSLAAALAQSGEEKIVWEMARAKCMSALTIPPPIV